MKFLKTDCPFLLYVLHFFFRCARCEGVYVVLRVVLCGSSLIITGKLTTHAGSAQ